MTLACEDAYSKLEVVTVAYVNDEDGVGNSLLQIWKLKFGQKALLTFVQTLSTRFGQDFDVVWLSLRSTNLVKILKLGLLKILSLRPSLDW